MPSSRKSGVELIDQIEAYVHRYKAWPAARGLELRELIERQGAAANGAPTPEPLPESGDGSS